MDSTNDKIRSSLLNVESLQKEYDVVLKKYQEAGKNYMNAIQTNIIDNSACKDFSWNSKGISQACYDKIWTDQGCTTTPPNADESWAREQTLDTLVTDSFLWATMTDDDHRKGCYGDSTNFTTNTIPIYPNNPCKDFTSDSTGITQNCYNKIWTDQGCTNTDHINDSAVYSWAQGQTLDALVNDSFLWATMTDDEHRKGCYGTSTNYTTNTSAVFPNVEAFSNKDSSGSDSKNSDSKNSDSNSNGKNGNGKNGNGKNGKTFVALKGKAWWGANGLAEGDAETQEDCEAMCANDKKCSGATFNPVKKYCWTRTGDGPVSTGEEDEYALIPKKTQALLMMKALNEQLLDINSQISTEINNVNPKVEAQVEENMINQQQLDENKKTLQEEKDKIKVLLSETKELQKENVEFSLFANQENIWIRFWILVTCLILLITVLQLTESPPSMAYRLLLMIILMVVTYTLSTPSGFVLVFFVLIGVIVLMMK
jgi:hypothetical protein